MPRGRFLPTSSGRSLFLPFALRRVAIGSDSGLRTRGAGQALRAISAILFTALLIMAPLNFGSTRQGGSEIISTVCTISTLVWYASTLCGAGRPRIPWIAAAGVTGVVLATLPWIAGWQTPTPVDSFTRNHFAQIVAKWPYGVLWRTPQNALSLTVAFAAAMLPLIDLSRSRVWAVVFSIAIVATAAGVAGLALLQNYTHATGIYWRDDGRMPGNFCGTFFHHTSAGAYFNTAWPLAFALTFLASSSPVLVALGGIATLIIVAGHASHVSRFPQVAGGLVAPFLLLNTRIRGQRTWLFAAAGIAVLAVLVKIGGRTDVIAARWHLLLIERPPMATSVQPPEDAWPHLLRDDLFIPSTAHPGLLGDRGESWRAALRSIAWRPIFGHGPGNWMGAASQTTADPFVRTFYQFLQYTHQDLLQFAVEFGVPAACAWWTVWVGGIVCIVRRRKTLGSFAKAIGVASACGLSAVLLQSQLDFPLQIPAVQLNALTLAALCWAAANSRTTDDQSRAL